MTARAFARVSDIYCQAFMPRWIAGFGAGLAVAVGAIAQQAISTRAGLVQRVEGRAQVSDVGPEGLPTDAFVQLEAGQRMRTLRGRAEIVLAPGTYVRFNAFSEVELVSADFSDIRVRLIEGAMVVDLADGKPGRDYNVTILYGDLIIQPQKRGEYELVARDPGNSELRVHGGRASVRRAQTPTGIRVEKGRELPLDRTRWGSARELSIESEPYRLSLLDWSRRRRAALAFDSREEPLWTTEPDLDELGVPPAAPTGPPIPFAPVPSGRPF